MKTKVILKSEDRNLFGVIIRQETKSNFLNLSDLQEAYTYARVLNAWPDKKIEHILSTKENHERIFYLLKKQGYINTDIAVFIENVKNETPARFLKKIKAYKTIGARQNKTTWCDSYLWVLIAMELNPLLYAEVKTWLTDKSILNRIEAGNMYIGLTKAISKFKLEGNHYVKLAKALNYIIFNKHETGIRNSASINQLKELEELEKFYAKAIDIGYINSFDNLLFALIKEYLKRYKSLAA